MKQNDQKNTSLLGKSDKSRQSLNTTAGLRKLSRSSSPEKDVICIRYYITAITSTSTNAPFGKAAAATQLRAGLPVKYFA